MITWKAAASIWSPPKGHHSPMVDAIALPIPCLPIDFIANSKPSRFLTRLAASAN